MKKEVSTIAELQQQATEALNKLSAAMKAEKFSMITPLHFYAAAFTVKDTEKGYIFTPNDLSNADHLKMATPIQEDYETGPIVVAHQKPMTIKVMTNEAKIRRVTRSAEID